MMYWLRYLLKEPYQALRTTENRELVKLLMKYGEHARHTPAEVQVAGFRLQVPDTMSFLWQYKEIFADEYYYFESPNAAPVIFDCGANIGMSVLYFKKLYPSARILAFEAEAGIASMLRNNLVSNGISDVQIIDKAVWKDDQGVWFGSEAADSSSIFSEADRKIVPSVRLRDYLRAEVSIDFLKIDIEGAEIEVLEDCRQDLGHVKNLFIEFHSYINHAQGLANVIAICEENGFRYYIDTNQHRLRPFTNHAYKNNSVMDLQLNIFCWRE